MFCSIAFPVHVRQTYTYLVPDNLSSKIKPGMRISASFGARSQIGYCVDVKEKLDNPPRGKLKTIQSLMDKEPIFSSEQIRLICWMSDYYLAPPGLVFKSCHPAEGGYKRSPHCFRVASESAGDWPFIPEQGLSEEAMIALSETDRKKVKLGLASGALYIDNIFPKVMKIRQMQAVRLIHRHESLKPRQQLVVDYLTGLGNQEEQIRVIERHCHVSRAVINTMIKNGILEKTYMEISSSPFSEDYLERVRHVVLSAEQSAAIENIASRFGEFYPVCLHGVPGSGKTEIYIDLADRVLQKDQSVIICVPEIAITPQIASRFRTVFGEKVAIWHSQMTDSERLWTWNQMLFGNIRIVVGARSALFSPLKNIGLIVIDEEQESSYKQDDKTPRYHGRDTAVKYAHILKCPVILGSATPSLETYYLSAVNKYQRIELTARFGDARFPEVIVSDMTKNDRKGIFSEPLLQEIYLSLERKEQVLLLQNRRGFHTVVTCSECGHIVQCPDCSISLTYHKRLNKLMCHACNRTFPLNRDCPSCGKPALRPVGTGTQRIEEEIEQLFPNARIARMDVDTTRTKSAHAKILSRFENKEFDILLGTQMIAKGLDFPNVTLVGVVNADVGMSIPDYRAGERLFQLIYQVCGRSGRGDKPGKAVIQTYNPRHPAIRLAAGLDLRLFYNMELYERKTLNYPPFSRMFLCRISGEDARKVRETAESMARYLQPQSDRFQLLGPAPAPSEKIRNRYRWQILVKTSRKTDPNGNQTAMILDAAAERFKKKTRDLIIYINRDPVSLM